LENGAIGAAGPTEEVDVAIVGGGQAGLSTSWHLSRRAIGHVVFEKRTALHVWRDARWDSFCLVTPNWQCRLPGYDYRGQDPHGFMRKGELIEWLDGFRASVAAPLREGVSVTRVRRESGGTFRVATDAGDWTANHVVVASGGYHVPVVPRAAEKLPDGIVQLHAGDYRNPDALPPGAVLVVGSGQSGAQIAEDLHLAGRKVFLAVGNAPRCARFHRGRDVVDWLADMKYYDMPVSEHPLREGVRDNTNHYVTGRDGGRDIDLRRFAAQGMELFGSFEGFSGGRLAFRPDLERNLDRADKVYANINATIDAWIAARSLAAPPGSPYVPAWRPAAERTSLDLAASGIAAVVWCVGFRPDFGWLDAPVFNGRGEPCHERGVTGVPGLYFVGLPWLHTWGSGRFAGVGRDAGYVAERIDASRRSPARATPVAFGGITA